MRLFSDIFKPKPASKTESIINLLKRWEQEHFPYSNYSYSSYTGTKINISRYTVYKSETGEKVQLSDITLPQTETSNVKRIVKAVVDWWENDKSSTLPYFIAEYRNNVATEVQRFRANCIKFNKLSDELKKDSLFSEIERLFHAKLKVLYNELLFCKFEKLGNVKYFQTIHSKLLSLCNDMKTLNTASADYMYALSRTEYESNKQDLERIRISVEAMSEVAEQYAEESYKI